MRYILLALLLGCTTSGKQYTCENFPVIEGGTVESLEKDMAAFNRAIVVCREKYQSCLEKLVVISPLNYHAYCNRSFRRDQ